MNVTITNQPQHKILEAMLKVKPMTPLQEFIKDYFPDDPPPLELLFRELYDKIMSSGIVTSLNHSPCVRVEDIKEVFESYGITIQE